MMLRIIRTTLFATNLLKEVAFSTRRLLCYSHNNSLLGSNICFSGYKDNNRQLDVLGCNMINIHRSMFIYRSGDMLWEGVTGPPGRSKKRARGKRRVVRNKVDLNLGRRIGESNMHYKFPGLNAPILEGKMMVKIEQGEKDDKYETKILDIRNRLSKRKVVRSVPPLKRGWTGSRLGGQSLGPPKPVLGQKWEGYDSRILELKVVSTMTGSKGRLRSFSALVMVGNFKGLAGIGKGKSTYARNALRIAKDHAIEKFEFYEIRDSRTLWHPDFVRDWNTKIYAKPVREGHGLVCHRLIKTMCQLIGIKDMYAKVEGSTTNHQVIARAFATLLRKQETYQSLANRMKLNVVEIRTECDNYPRLLAAPDDGVTRTPDPEEMLDFDRLHVDGKVFRTKKYRPFYLDTPGPQRHAMIRHRFRNQEIAHRTRAVYEYLAGEGHLAVEKLTDNE